MEETTEPLDDLAVWNCVRPLIRSMKPTSLEVSIYNSGDIAETRAEGKKVPGLTSGFELKPGKKGLSCPDTYDEIRVDIWTDGNKVGTHVRFRTKGGGNKEGAWQRHQKAVEDLLPKGIYMAEKCVVQTLMEDAKCEAKRLQELLVRAKGVVRD